MQSMDAATSPLLGEVLREMRTVAELTGRQLAEQAQLSHTQISRIESGATAAPSEQTVKRLARALNFNHRPLLVLAGHLRGEAARAELLALTEEHRDLFWSWEGSVGMTLEEARAVLADPTSTDVQLARVAKELALWANAEDDGHNHLTDPSTKRLLDLWQVLGERPREDLLTYGEALREVQTLEFGAAQKRLELKRSLSEDREASKVAAPFSEADLRRRGFEGFLRVQDLRSDLSRVPGNPGVYAVVRAAGTAPTFLSTSVGGHFKQQDPTVDVRALKDAWVDCQTLYFGKADSKRTPLRTRLNDLAKFASGLPAAHWGGRSLWQLADHDQLLVCWLKTPEPAAVESDLIDEFVATHGALPFANMRRPSRSR